jgi:CBS domain containing-hemolysin-like protein
VLLDGNASLRDLVTQLHWKLPREAGVETLAGLLLTRLGHIPATGENVEIDGRRFTVVEVDRRRISKVRVEELNGTPENAASEEQRTVGTNG